MLLGVSVTCGCDADDEVHVWVVHEFCFGGFVFWGLSSTIIGS